MNLQQINSKADEIIALANSSRNTITKELEKLKYWGIETLEIGIDSYSDDGEVITELTYIRINELEYFNDEIESTEIEDLLKEHFSLLEPILVKRIIVAIISLFHGETNQLFKLL